MPEPVPHKEEIQQDASAPRRAPNRLYSLLVTLATIGTILGGVLAAFQIYEHVFKRETDTKSLSLDAGASLEVPKDWELMNQDAIQVMTRGIDPQFDALLNNPDAKCLQFIGPHEVREGESGVVCVVIGTTIPDLTYEEVVSNMQRFPGCTLCKIVELDNGRGVHCVCLRETYDPEGYPVPVTQDCYVFIRGDDMWFLMFICEDPVYMRESAKFAKIAGSFKVD